MNGLKWILVLLVVSAVSNAAEMDAAMPEAAAVGHAEQAENDRGAMHPEAQTQANIDRRLMEYTNACLLARPTDPGMNIPADQIKTQ